MRNHYLTIAHLFLLAVFLPACFSGCRQAREEDPVNTSEPVNILLIMTDDQGYGDLGFHGNPLIRTPVLDSLARLSTRLTQFYVSPVCAPTRSSLLTGRYSVRTGVYDTYNGGAMMADTEITLAEYLKTAGYATGMFGKWHLGDNYPFRPVDQGFDESWMHAAGGIGQPGDFYENYMKGDSSYFNPVLSHNGSKEQTKGYCSDVYTDQALRFMEAHAGQPFFIYLAFNAPHEPLQLPEHYLKMYRDIPQGKFEEGTDSRRLPLSEREIEAARRVFGMVTNIDDNLGRLFRRINDLGLAENTLVIFLTDNGPQHRRFNAGLRSIKGSVYEGGTRVPSFWHLQGQLPYDREINEPAAHIDVLPTLIDLCGLQADPDSPPDGLSLWPLLTGSVNELPERPLFTYWVRGYLQPYSNIAVRSGKYKMVGQVDYQSGITDLELYDMEDDPGEHQDISQQYPDTVAGLKKQFDDWYWSVINNQSLKPQRIRIGSDKEDPVTLNRNDTKGPMARRWMDSRAPGYWETMIEETGLYDIRIRFFEPLGPGSLTFRAGTIQRTVNMDQEMTDLFELPAVRLIEGEAMVEAWYDRDGLIYAPIYVEIEKIESNDE